MNAESYAAVAERLGFEYSSTADDPLQFEIEMLFAGRRNMTVTNVLEKYVDDVRLVVANVEFARHSSSRDVKVTRQTVAYFETDSLELPDLSSQPHGWLGDTLELPDLSLQPRRWVGDILLRIGQAVGLQVLEFPENARFADQYCVQTFQPTSATRLMRAGVVDHLSARPGWSLLSNLRHATVYYRETVFSPDALPQFIDDAQQFLAVVKKAVRTLHSEGWTPQKEALTFIRKRPTFLRLVMQSHSASAEDISEFLQQTPPRTIAGPIKRSFVGSNSLLFYIIGAAVTFVGSVLTAASSISDADTPGLVRGLLVIPVLGVTVLAATWQYRQRTLRILRNGVYCEAMIDSIVGTDRYVDNQQTYIVTFGFEWKDESKTARVNAPDLQVRHAKLLADGGTSTRILVAPGNPEKILWIDSTPM